jgi:putative addiction module component (TIGR02574 family)
MSDLLDEIAKLTIAERIQLVQAILDTIAQENTAELSEEHLAEIKARSESIRNGTARTIPWNTIQAQIATRYGSSR